MSEHVALLVDRLVSSTAGNGDSTISVASSRASFATKKAASTNGNRLSKQKSSPSLAPKEGSELLRRSGSIYSFLDGNLGNGLDASKPPLREAASAECRICQEEDDIANLESPCACTGSLKFAHRNCVQHWCDEKGDTICEICRKPYAGGYIVPPSSARSDYFPISIRGSWDIASGRRLDLHEPRLFSVASEHQFLDSDYEEYTRAKARSAACFRSVAFILMVLLLLHHVLSVSTTVSEEDASTFIMLFILRVVGFFLPCYILARALNILHCRHRRRQEAALAAAEVAYLLQSGHVRGLPIALSSGQSE